MSSIEKVAVGKDGPLLGLRLISGRLLDLRAGGSVGYTQASPFARQLLHDGFASLHLIFLCLQL